MNAKRLFTVLGLGAIGVMLVALPGSSARKRQDPTPKPLVDCTQDLETVQVYNDEQLPLVSSDFDELTVDDGDDNVSVVVGDGHGWLGVGVTEVTSEKAKELKLPAERGVVLGKIVPDSPAAKAGLKENDVVTEINGQRVEGTEQFRRMIREIPSGRTAQLTVWRDGRSQSVNVTVGKSGSQFRTSIIAPGTPPGTFAFNMPNMPELQGRLNELMENGPWFVGRPRLGIDAEDLQGEFGNFFGAPDGEGVLVRGVFSDSPAAKAGLKVGDVITSVDGDRVHSTGEFREKLVEKHSEKSVKLGILRNKAQLLLTVELPPPPEKREHHSSVRTNI